MVRSTRPGFGDQFFKCHQENIPQTSYWSQEALSSNTASDLFLCLSVVTSKMGIKAAYLPSCCEDQMREHLESAQRSEWYQGVLNKGNPRFLKALLAEPELWLVL